MSDCPVEAISASRLIVSDSPGGELEVRARLLAERLGLQPDRDNDSAASFETVTGSRPAPTRA